MRGYDGADLAQRASRDGRLVFLGISSPMEIARAVARDFGLREIDPATVAVGDIALVDDPNGNALALVTGTRCVSLMRRGLLFSCGAPLAAWRV